MKRCLIVIIDMCLCIDQSPPTGLHCCPRLRWDVGCRWFCHLSTHPLSSGVCCHLAWWAPNKVSSRVRSCPSRGPSWTRHHIRPRPQWLSGRNVVSHWSICKNWELRRRGLGTQYFRWWSSWLDLSMRSNLGEWAATTQVCDRNCTQSAQNWDTCVIQDISNRHSDGPAA